jgi:hypothetical protein
VPFFLEQNQFSGLVMYKDSGSQNEGHLFCAVIIKVRQSLLIFVEKRQFQSYFCLMSTTTPAAGSFQPGLNQASLLGKNAVAIRRKSKTTLASEYDVARSTMSKMCIEAGVTSTKKLSINEVLAVYEKHGYPGNYNVSLQIGPATQD